ncbi:MAG: hypothetical protein VX655_04615, partial [Candidatus Thermoplasmatota archaeon]|nr:hypothetical protein [Candidatus Thermoplasmatota archaeon]
MVDIFRLLGLPSPSSSSSSKEKDSSRASTPSGPTKMPSSNSSDFIDLSSIEWARKAGPISPDRYLR